MKRNLALAALSLLLGACCATTQAATPKKAGLQTMDDFEFGPPVPVDPPDDGPVLGSADFEVGGIVLNFLVQDPNKAGYTGDDAQVSVWYGTGPRPEACLESPPAPHRSATVDLRTDTWWWNSITPPSGWASGQQYVWLLVEIELDDGSGGKNSWCWSYRWTRDNARPDEFVTFDELP